MKRHRIYLSILTVVILNTPLFGGDLIYPEVYTFRDFNLAKLNQPGSIVVVNTLERIPVVNNTNEIIYLLGNSTKILYDSTIWNNGNQCQITQLSNHQIGGTLYPGDTSYFVASIGGKYIDEYSSKNEYLQALGTIFFRRFSSNDYDSINILLKFRVIDKESIIFDNSRESYSKKSSKKFGNEQALIFKKYFIRNAYLEDMMIDSIQYKIHGNNFKGLLFSLAIGIYDSIVTLPYKLSPFEAVHLKADFKSEVPFHNKITFKLFCTLDSSSRQIVYEDSVLAFESLADMLYLDTRSYDPLIKTAELNLMQSFNPIVFRNNTDTTMKLVNHYITNFNDDSVFLNDMQMIPYDIESYKEGRVYPPDFLAMTPGFKKFLYTMEFESHNGDKISHNVLYKIFVDTPSDVPINSDVNNTLLLYPLPAKEFFTIQSVNNGIISSVHLYNLLGKQIISSYPNDSRTEINTRDLTSGLYFAVVGLEGQIYYLKVIIE